MMALDKHRLNHLSKQGVPGAIRSLRLLKKIDRLIGTILLGNNFVNILASAITTIIALRLGGEIYIASATGMLTFVILIFAEVAPKTVAAKHPERIAFNASLILQPLLKILGPIVYIVNIVANSFLWLVGQSQKEKKQVIDTQALRSIIEQSGHGIPEEHQDMILRMLELSDVNIEEIMIQRHEIVGLDIQDDIEHLLILLTNVTYTRLPVYDGSIDEVKGVLHIREALRLLDSNTLNAENILQVCEPVYFIPESTNLLTQLQNFRNQQKRMAFIINEYGNIRGLTTIVDILEEVVGDFSSDIADVDNEIVLKEKGVWHIDASVSLREINEYCNVNLSSENANTLNGLIIELLGEAPQAPLSIAFEDCKVTVLQYNENSVLMIDLITPTEHIEKHSDNES